MALPEDHPPWDAGLQNERTGLAWQRTMLSGLACGLIVTRLLAGVSLTLAILTGVGMLALGLARVSRHRAVRWPVTALVFVLLLSLVV